MAHVLLVDDDPRLVRTLSINLRARGYEVSTATTGARALQLAAQAQPDVIILDMGLPDIDGSIVLEGIRGWSDVPVIVLTARTDPLFSASSLDKGADDYVTKPFSMEELLARVRAALRHGGPRASGAAKAEEITVVTAGNLVIDLAQHTVTKKGHLVHLTPTEWGVLSLLIRAGGGLVRKEELLSEVWGTGFESQGHYLRIYTSQLRRKLEDDPAHPVHVITETGLGYRFVIGPA
ncbi:MULTISPECIES: response regulator [Corynebacterium]|uniref:response regulator n=1 Tax=Corynebacterium TaxID=1716 RepID=UPI0008A2140B|nr:MULTISPECIES: response regulator transcription factor [Corynebacterium]MCT1442111.1 response regulator transcription factor [Corynebacterium glucuronolyticum]MCT1563759.1 response regulator transcription factor [Corynebacterium glucuronolyticum]OFO47946.1 DNA-binding response regulator [Corynebacterium sp. HMSC073D01]QQU89026.1 response regulator transcription factor [Corynebacterium glucuronolyticum]